MIDVGNSWTGLVRLPSRAGAPADIADPATAMHPAAGPGAHPLTVLGGATAVALLVGAAGPVVAVMLAISMLTLPGMLVLPRVRTVDRAEALVVVVGTSVVVWALVAHAQLSFGWWHPRQVAAGVVGGFAVLHGVAVHRRRSDAPRLYLGPSATLRAWRWQLGAVHTLLVAVAFALWAASLTGIDTTDISDWGLAARLPVTWFAALGVAVVAATRASVSRVSEPLRVATGLGAVAVILYATLPLVVSTIRYPWSYKHLGVVRLLDVTGRVHQEVDIYNNFSGMFGAVALVRGATGVDPESYAAWWQFGVTAFVLVAVWSLARRLSGSARVANLAALLYIVTDWVGQNYFSSQSVALFLALATLGLVGGWLRAPLDPVGRGVTWARRGVVVLLFLGVLMMHPLTPVVVVLPVMAAVALRWLRDVWVLVGGLLVTGLWVARCLPYFHAQGWDLGFGGSVTANAAGNRVGGDPPPVFELMGHLTRGFAVGVWLLALVGAVVARRRGVRVGMAVLVALSPFAILVMNSYGGEAVYRVYLYSLAGMVTLAAAGLLAHRRDRPASGRWVVRSLVVLVVTAGFVVVHFGRERLNNVERGEVAIEHLLGSLPDREYIAAHFAGLGPRNVTATYPQINVDDTWTPSVVESLDRDSPVPFTEQLDEVADDLLALTDGNVYLTLTPSMFEELRAQGGWPFDEVADGVELLATNPRFVPVAHIDDAWLYRVLR